MMKLKSQTLALALAIAILPPIWAVAAPYIGVSVGPVALICASFYTLTQHKLSDAVQLTTGLLLGLVWTWIALFILGHSPLDGQVTLFLTLAIMGGLAVIFQSFCSSTVSLQAWLGGWAIGLTVVGPAAPRDHMSLLIQLAIAMVVGIWYIGYILDQVVVLIKSALDK